MLLNPYLIKTYSLIPLKGRIISNPTQRFLSYPIIGSGQESLQKNILYLYSIKDENLFHIQPTAGCILISGVPNEKRP